LRAFAVNQLLPAWTLTSNSIYSNATYNLYLQQYNAFLNPATSKVLVKNNWWGSADPSTIASTIFDYSDSASVPTADFGNYLAADGGSPVAGVMLSGGSLSANTTIASGVSAQVLGTLQVLSGVTLTVQSGATLKIIEGAAIQVQSGGVLNIQGSSASKALLTSSKTTKAKGDWKGITINTGATATITHAIIEYATDAVAFVGPTTGTVSALGGALNNSELRFNTSGVYLSGYVNPTIQTNTMHDNTNGIFVDANSTTLAASPSITGNRIYNNSSFGVVLRAFAVNQLLPAWTLTSNSIYSNATYNLYLQQYNAFLNPATSKVLVKNNWWGSADPSTIAGTIYDYSDSASLPTADFGNYLSAEGGAAVAGLMVSGRISDQAGVVFQSGQVYQVIGEATVPAGETLTIPGGVTFRFVPGTSLTVQGSLSVTGTAGNEVVFTSAKALPAASDWDGIWVKSGSTTVNLNYVVIQYASGGLRFDASGSVGVVNNALVQFCNYGVHVNGTAHPTISSSRLVTNSYGVYVYGNNNDTTDPKPVLKNNDIFNNASGNILSANYTASPTTKIDVTGVWWGTASPTFTGNVLNYSPVSTAPLKAPIAKIHSIANVYFSPNADSVQDTANLTSTLSESSAWTVDVKNLTSGANVRSFSGSGTSVVVNWDGKNTSAQDVSDGAYAFVMRTSAATRSGYALQRQVIVDRTPPVAVFDLASLPATLRNVVSTAINGSARDAYFSSYTVDYATSPTSGTWNAIASNVGTQVNNAQLAMWTVGTTTGGSVVPNGNYFVRLTAKDLAGNQSVVTANVAIDNISLLSVSAAGQVDVSSGQTAAINFTMNLPGTATIKIYDMSTGVAGQPIATITQAFTSSGAKSLTWNGRDSNGNIVPGKAYIFVIEVDDGTRHGLFDVTSEPLSSAPATFVSNQTCSATKNEFYKLVVTAPQSGLAGAQITLPSQNVYPFGAIGTPIPAGTTTVYWDCRDPDTGAILTFSSATEYFAFTKYPINTILVTGNDTVPKISGLSPTIEVKSDPYLIYISYGNFTKIAYSLALPNATSATVQIKLLPPGVLSFDDASALLVYSGTRNAGTHEVTWNGTLAGNEGSSSRIMRSSEGAYTFAIKATANGLSTLYRGTLTTYQ